MILQNYNNITVLRDDLLVGGTKSTFVDKLLKDQYDYYVQATPAYGGFQIALAGVCKQLGKKCVIFVAKRENPHKNSLHAKKLGATVYQVPYGYLSNIQSKAKQFCKDNNGQLLEFGAKNEIGLNAIEQRTKNVIKLLGAEPDYIYCAVGSGTLINGIHRGTTKSKIIGVSVGKEFTDKLSQRVQIIKYDRSFDKEARIKPPFQSCENYDAKVWEVLIKKKPSGKILFWNVL